MVFFSEWNDCPFPEWMTVDYEDHDSTYSDDKQAFYQAWLLTRQIKTLSLDEVMEKMQSWYKYDTIVRDELFNLIHVPLQNKFGEYWLHEKSPWQPISV